MKSVFDHIRSGLYDRLQIDTYKPINKFVGDLKKTEWCEEFEQYMRNRLIMGAIRYGRLGAMDKPDWDRLGGIKMKLKQYEETGNDELLVDVANLALVEFVEGKHPKKHFNAMDDSEHIKIK